MQNKMQTVCQMTQLLCNLALIACRIWLAVNEQECDVHMHIVAVQRFLLRQVENAQVLLHLSVELLMIICLCKKL